MYNIVMNKDKITFKFGELFCGPGGLAYGAVNAKVNTKERIYSIEHAWSNDYDEDTCETYRNNICPDNRRSVICEDIRKINIKELGSIDCFAYGFPCNDFSIVGEQKGFDGEFGPLYTHGIKVLNYYKPKFFVAENVGGMSSANNGKAFQKILYDLKNAGNTYDLTVHKYKCEEYGVPQTRHRIIIVGIDSTSGLAFRVPAPTTKTSPVTAKSALENPDIPENAPNNEMPVCSAQIRERLRYIKPGQNAWNADIPKHLQLNVKGAKLSQIYRRLDPDTPSYTITGSGGGGTHGYHWEEPRPLTNRERARIQTFPDNFTFHGRYGSVRKQIGMSVPPKMSEVIFTAVLKTFAGIKYQSVDSNMTAYFSNLFSGQNIVEEKVCRT